MTLKHIAIRLVLLVGITAPTYTQHGQLEKEYSRTSRDFHDACMTFDGRYVLAGERGVWISNEDGVFVNRSWFPSGTNVVHIGMVDTVYGYVIAWKKDNYTTSNGRVYQTKNGGQSFHLIKDGFSQPICGAAFDDNIIISCKNDFVQVSRDGGESWTQVEQPYSEPLTDIQFISRDTVVAVGPHGLILRSVNAGVSWIEIETGEDHQLNSVDIDGDGHGLAVGFGTSVYETFNWGESWTRWPPEQILSATGYGGDIRFANVKVRGTTASLTSADEGVLWVMQGKSSWKNIDRDGCTIRGTRRKALPTDSGLLIYGSYGLLEFYDPAKASGQRKHPRAEIDGQYSVVLSASCAEIYGFTSLGHVHRTQDGGQSWWLTSNSLSVTCADSEDDVLYAAGDRFVATSRDHGQTWAKSASTIGDARCIDIFSPTLGFIGCEDGVLYRSVTGGTTWRERKLPSTNTVSDIAVMASDLVYALCGSVVYESRDQGDTWNEVQLPVSAAISQIQPSHDGHLVVAFYKPEGSVIGRYDPAISEWTIHEVVANNPPESYILDLEINENGCGIATSYFFTLRTTDGFSTHVMIEESGAGVDAEITDCGTIYTSGDGFLRSMCGASVTSVGPEKSHAEPTGECRYYDMLGREIIGGSDGPMLRVSRTGNRIQAEKIIVAPGHIR